MTLWYATRAFGIVCLTLFSAVVVLGLLTAGRRAVPRRHRFVVAGVHRTLSLTSMVFLALHIVSAVGDGFVPLTWWDTVIPFRSAYQPLWTGLGAVALDLLIALAVTSLLRDGIGWRTWRAIHWAAYACWPAALAHGLGQGTDRTSALLLLPAALSVLAVATAVVLRVRARPRGTATQNARRRGDARQPAGTR
jgi:DMSO/TMAO reductase YedYZ heme-binding membrane subunit